MSGQWLNDSMNSPSQTNSLFYVWNKSICCIIQSEICTVVCDYLTSILWDQIPDLTESGWVWELSTDLDSFNKLEYIFGWIFNNYQFYFILGGLNKKLQICTFRTSDKIPCMIFLNEIFLLFLSICKRY